jgi:phosphoribosylamine-glycine ligase
MKCRFCDRESEVVIHIAGGSDSDLCLTCVDVFTTALNETGINWWEKEEGNSSGRIDEA